jgi:hypothetical protein
MNKEQAQMIGSEIALDFVLDAKHYYFDGVVVHGYGLFPKKSGTEENLEYYRKNKDQLGNIVSLRCHDSGHLLIWGSKNHMELPDCKCAYGGQGSRGTGEILKDLGFSQEVSDTLSQKLIKFNVSVPFD